MQTATIQRQSDQLKKDAEADLKALVQKVLETKNVRPTVVNVIREPLQPEGLKIKIQFECIVYPSKPEEKSGE